MILALLLKLSSLRRTNAEGAPGETFSLRQAALFLNDRIKEHVRETSTSAHGYPLERTYKIRSSPNLVALSMLAVRKPLKMQEGLVAYTTRDFPMGPSVGVLESGNTLLCIRSTRGYLFYATRTTRLLGDGFKRDASELLCDIKARRLKPIKRPVRGIRSARVMRKVLEEGVAFIEKLKGKGHLTRGFFFTGIHIPKGSPAVGVLCKLMKRTNEGTYEDENWELHDYSTTWRLMCKRLDNRLDSNSPWIYDQLAQFLCEKGLPCRSYYRPD